jgi:hypothetical protein
MKAEPNCKVGYPPKSQDKLELWSQHCCKSQRCFAQYHRLLYSQLRSHWSFCGWSSHVFNGRGNLANGRILPGHSGVYVETGEILLSNCNVSANIGCGITLMSPGVASLTMTDSDMVMNAANSLEMPFHSINYRRMQQSNNKLVGRGSQSRSSVLRTTNEKSESERRVGSMQVLLETIAVGPQGKGGHYILIHSTTNFTSHAHQSKTKCSLLLFHQLSRALAQTALKLDNLHDRWQRAFPRLFCR